MKVMLCAASNNICMPNIRGSMVREVQSLGEINPSLWKIYDVFASFLQTEFSKTVKSDHPACKSH